MLESSFNRPGEQGAEELSQEKAGCVSRPWLVCSIDFVRRPSRAPSRSTFESVLGGHKVPLENIVNSVAVSDSDLRSIERGLESLHRANSDRFRSWELRSVLWLESSLPALLQCGRVPITVSGEVYPVPNGRNIYYSGLDSCGSVWACPVCSPKIHGRRRGDLALLLKCALEHGSGAFGAYTLRHDRSQSLEYLQGCLSKCWSAVNRDWAVRQAREKLGWIGVVLSREHTFTWRNGWHPHLHPLHLFDRKVTVEQVADLQAIEFAVWKRFAEKLGLGTPLERAQELHLVVISEKKPLMDVVEYIAKGNLNPRSAESVAWEMAPGNKKTYTQSSQSLTPFDILEKVSLSVTSKERSKWLGVWHEYERATKGRSALTYSKGLRERFGLRGVIKDEVEIQELEPARTVFDFGFVITDWTPFKRNFRLGAGLLGAISPKGYWDEGRVFCKKNRIDYVDLVSPDRSLHIGQSVDQLVFDIPKVWKVEKTVPLWEQVSL